MLSFFRLFHSVIKNKIIGAYDLLLKLISYSVVAYRSDKYI